jgi:thimet oligopeptidase
VRTQLFYTSYSLDVHNQPPEKLDPDKLLEEGYKRMMPYEWVDGNRMYASFTHLIGYSSNYYTYMFDKVIALDFFGQFDRCRTCSTDQPRCATGRPFSSPADPSRARS